MDPVASGEPLGVHYVLQPVPGPLTDPGHILSLLIALLNVVNS